MVTIFCLPPILRHAAVGLSVSAGQRVSHYPHQFSTGARLALPGRTYEEAIKLLNSLQSNRTVVSAISNSSHDANKDAIPEMLEWTRRAGYEVSDFAKHGLKCVHVAGTKGKGSVCAMVENILMQYRGKDMKSEDGKREYIGKVGLYTSPHLVTVRERIRIDGSPISESMFAQYFFELWDRLSNITASKFNAPQPETQSSKDKPGYFRYLTLLALHTFMKEGVETAILESGIGGEYDSTNILPPDAVTVSAITRLGIDHVGMLGHTIEEIAWHKAGIMKKGVPAFTVEQLPAAQAVLEKRALQKGVQLSVAESNPVLETGDVKLGLEGDVQRDNARLAIALAGTQLRHLGVSTETDQARPIPNKFILGLETVRLQGRCEVRDEGKILWLIDGAHTKDSIEATAHWYTTKLEEAKASLHPPTATMLIFNQQDRDAGALITFLIHALSKTSTISNKNDVPWSWQQRTRHLNFCSEIAVMPNFSYAAFCQNTAFKNEVEENVSLAWQNMTAKVYESADTNALHTCYGSVEEAVELARKISDSEGERLLVLVTGSLHLVGGLLQVLERDQRTLKVSNR